MLVYPKTTDGCIVIVSAFMHVMDTHTGGFLCVGRQSVCARDVHAGRILFYRNAVYIIDIECYFAIDTHHFKAFFRI